MPSADGKLVRVGPSQEDKEWRGGDWDASERWWQMLQWRVGEERREKGYVKMQYENLGKPRVREQAQWDKVSQSYPVRDPADWVAVDHDDV